MAKGIRPVFSTKAGTIEHVPDVFLEGSVGPFSKAILGGCVSCSGGGIVPIGFAGGAEFSGSGEFLSTAGVDSAVEAVGMNVGKEI